MTLSILDLRDNLLSMPKVRSKFLKNTILLAWDNGLSEKKFETYLNNAKILGSYAKGGKEDLSMMK
jgi:hypothetical protein